MARRVRRWAVVGLTLGLLAGLALAAPRGGDALVTPVLIPLLGVLGGGLLGAGIGLAIVAWGARAEEVEAVEREAAEAEARRRPAEAGAPGAAPSTAPDPPEPGAPGAAPSMAPDPVEPDPAARLAALPGPAPDADGTPAGPGWHTDPLDETAKRLWDGEAWTPHTWRPRPRSRRR